MASALNWSVAPILYKPPHAPEKIGFKNWFKMCANRKRTFCSRSAVTIWSCSSCVWKVRKSGNSDPGFQLVQYSSPSQIGTQFQERSFGLLPPPPCQVAASLHPIVWDIWHGSCQCQCSSGFAPPIPQSKIEQWLLLLMQQNLVLWTPCLWFLVNGIKEKKGLTFI